MNPRCVALCILVVCVHFALGHVEIQLLPTFWATVNGLTPKNGVVNNNGSLNVTVSIGDLVTLACYYSDPAAKVVEVVISKWHPRRQEQRLLPLVKDRNFEDQFVAIRNNSPLANRYSLWLNATAGQFKVAYLNISNFQLEDAGDYACQVSVKEKNARTGYANVSLKLFPSAFGVDMEVQQVALGTSELLNVNCTVFRSESYEEPLVRFDVCDVQPGEYQRSPICEAGSDGNRNNKSGVYLWIEMPYSSFWQRVMVRDLYTADLRVQDSFANKSLGCFVHNKATRTYVRDYATMVRSNERLLMNPFNFNCTQQHLRVPRGQLGIFQCNVTHSAFRTPVISWQLLTSAHESPAVCTVGGHCTVGSSRVTQSQLEPSGVEGRYERITSSHLAVQCNKHNDGGQFTLLEIYPEYTHRSTVFTLSCHSARVTAAGLLLLLQVLVLVAVF